MNIPEENGIKNLTPNTTIYHEGEKIKNISIITKGEIDVYISSRELIGIEDEEEIMKYSCKLFSIPRNIMIGIGAFMYDSNYIFSFKSKNDNEIYTINIPDIEYIKTFFNSNRTYLTNMYHSLAYMIMKTYDEYIKIKKINDELKIVTTNLGVMYFNLNAKNKNIKSELFLKTKEVFEYATNDGFNFPTDFNTDFIKEDHEEIYNNNKNKIVEENEKLEFEIEYIKRFLTMPKEIKAPFFSYDVNLTLSATAILYQTLKDIADMLKFEFISTMENISFLYSNNQESLFTEYSKMAFELEKQGKNYEVWARYSRYIGNTTKDVCEKIKNKYDYDLNIDIDELESTIKKLTENINSHNNDESNSEENNVQVIMGVEAIPEEIRNPSKKIIEMSGIPEDRASTFFKSLNAFKKLKDKFSTEDDARKIRRSVTNVFFEVYKEIAKKYIINSEKNKLFSMFLNFGYMDDQLLTPNQIVDLYEVKDKTSTKKINVFYIDEWLQKIYDKEEPPSVNGFGQDYREALREMKKRGIISDHELEEHWESPLKRLEYEIDNMIETTHRLCYGQISVYLTYGVSQTVQILT